MVGCTVCVLGLGYIGLPTASLLATKGFQVRGVDISPQVVESINAGLIHIVEPDLDAFVRSAVQSGRLTAGLEPQPADVFIIAVPTPFSHGYRPDLSFVEAASRAISPHLRGGNLVILESTSPVGTTELVAKWIAQMRPDLANRKLYIAHCPERVLPGHIIRELVDNDRIVGGLDEDSAKAAAEFYRSFVGGEVFVTNSRTAELTKLAENTFRDVNIALANELSIICDRLDVDVWKLIELANRHPRVRILAPGPGVGGHCVAVDPWFIVDSAPEQARLIRTAREINNSKPAYVVERVRARASHLNNPTISCFGLTYKADIDDMRESPALDVVERLAEAKLGKILVVEPYIQQLPPRLAELGARLVDCKEALSSGDIVVGLVDHREFRRITTSELAGKGVVDTRGIWK